MYRMSKAAQVFRATICVFCAVLLVAGCNKGASDGSGGSSSESSAGTTKVAAGIGESLFKTSGCSNCHALNGGGGKAPDLSHAGAEAGHDADWISAHIKNPKSHNPTSRMPAGEGKIKDEDIKTLGTYLASLK